VFFKGDQSDKLHILIEGSVRMFKEDGVSPLMSAIHIINGDILDAITPLPMNFSAFVIGTAKFLYIDLKTFLSLKKKFVAKKGSIFC